MPDSTPSHKQLVDKADNLCVPISLLRRYHNDFQARDSLWSGLELLYAQTRKVETTLVPAPVNGAQSVTWGNIPGVPVQVLRQVSCFFDWYSVSASSFVLLTAWLLEKAGQIESSAKHDYRRKVIPDVIAHRNKVGAHPSRVLPKSDELATQEASNMRQLALVNDRFWANYMTLARRSGTDYSDSRKLRPWSLTEMHERLRQRYVVSQACGTESDADVQEATNSKDVDGGKS